VELSIIIVHYRVKKILEECIKSILANKVNFDFEIIIVDNFSQDDSNELAEKYPIQWIQNIENVGFSKANNLGVEKAKGEYVLILNPDTVLPEYLLQEVLDFSLKIQNLGALGVRMVNKDGIFHRESKRSIPNPRNTFKKLFASIFNKNAKNSEYYYTLLGEFEVGKVPILTGAFMWMKRVTYMQVGGFDSTYFMYGEDIDLSYTFLKNGFQNYYYGKQTIIHYKGESTVKDYKYYKNFFNAMEIFVRKYYLKSNYFTGMVLITGLRLRFYLALMIHYFNKVNF
jgi:N-acetylglucosaminyl-diphospho-decaprenol L-rhamnosyltransferase